MNAMKRLTAAALAAILLIMPMCGLAKGFGGFSGMPGGMKPGQMAAQAAEEVVEEVEDKSSERHQKEKQRVADAVDGLTASPFWLYQMYLSYHSFNLRFYDASGNKLLFFENLKKLYLKTGYSKALTLTVKSYTITGIVMKMDEEALIALEHYGISRLGFFDYDENPYGQFSVQSFRDAFDSLCSEDEPILVYNIETETFSAEEAEN